MTAISVRLPEAVTRALDAEAALSGRPRSAVIREALEGFLQARAQAHLAAELASAARNLALDPAAMAEAQALAEEFLIAENEALALAEGPGITPEQWWK